MDQVSHIDDVDLETAPAAATVAPRQRAAPQKPAPARPRVSHEAAMLRTAWAVRPCAIGRGNRADAPPRPWLQFRGPTHFEWNCVDLPVPGLPPALAGLRIVHLSDFHTGPRWAAGYDKLLERLGRDPPDLLLHTGDFVDNRRNPLPSVPFVHRLLEGFTARLGCFGILGNHDRYHFAPHLDGTNVTLLDEKRHVIEHDGARIELIGLPGVDRRDLRWEWLRTLPHKPEHSVRIVLSHFPDHLPRVQGDLRPDLFLTGHSHGGQICLPGGAPIITHTSLPRHLCKGIHRVDGTWLVAHRGFGYTGIPVRLFCPPEVIELRLTR